MNDASLAPSFERWSWSFLVVKVNCSRPVKVKLLAFVHELVADDQTSTWDWLTPSVPRVIHSALLIALCLYFRCKTEPMLSLIRSNTVRKNLLSTFIVATPIHIGLTLPRTIKNETKVFKWIMNNVEWYYQFGQMYIVVKTMWLSSWLKLSNYISVVLTSIIDVQQKQNLLLGVDPWLPVALPHCKAGALF